MLDIEINACSPFVTDLHSSDLLTDRDEGYPILKFSALGTFKWWISGLMLDPLFFSISRLTNACSSLVTNLQID